MLEKGKLQPEITLKTFIITFQRQRFKYKILHEWRGVNGKSYMQ